MAYNTVKTAKVVDRGENQRAVAMIDGCTFITPEISRQIDEALGVGTMDTDRKIDLTPDIVIFNESEIFDILDAAGPSVAALRAIEAEQVAEEKAHA